MVSDSSSESGGMILNIHSDLEAAINSFLVTEDSAHDEDGLQAVGFTSRHDRQGASRSSTWPCTGRRHPRSRPPRP
jgi:hypothetical protein